MKNLPKPPPNLSRTAMEWWRAVMEAYEFEPPEMALVEAAAWALHRSAQARAVIEKDGLTYFDPKRGPRMRPEVVIERDSRSAFARLSKQLGIGETEPKQPIPGTRQHRRK